MKILILLSGLFLSSILLSSIVFAQGNEYGINTHFWQANDWTNSAADLFVKTGAKWVRSDIPSASYPYDYSGFISNLERAKARDLNVLLIIWHPIAFDNLQQYEDYVAAVANQFKGYVDAYEIWSEPVGHRYGYFNCTQGEDDYTCTHEVLPAKYFEMLKIAYQTIKSIDTHPVIVGIGGTYVTYGSDELWFCQKVVELGGKNYMDAFSLHPYDPLSWTPEEPPWSDVAIGNIKNRIISHQNLFSPLPLWVTETGFSDMDGDQSWAMNRIFNMLDEVGANKTFWYEFRNDEVHPTPEQRYYGLTDSSLNPKPSFYNLKSFLCTDGSYPDSHQPQCINQNPNYASANQVRDYYSSNGNCVCSINFDSYMTGISVNGMNSGDATVFPDDVISVIFDVKNTGSMQQGWWMVGVEFWKVNDYRNPSSVRSKKLNTYYNGYTRQGGNYQGLAGAGCNLISDPNGNGILDSGETVKVKCYIPASYYGVTSGNQRIMFWLHERDYGQDAGNDGCGSDNCHTTQEGCPAGKCLGGSWWNDALSRVEPANVRVKIISRIRTGGCGRACVQLGLSSDSQVIFVVAMITAIVLVAVFGVFKFFAKRK